MVDVPDDLELSPPQARVLGCLMEKEATTPDTYPMTLKALTTACNQTSSRHPVVQYEPTLVEATVHALKGKGVARIVHPARGERSTKFRHVLDEALGLDRAQLAVLCVLLLRGAQTVNELRTRTERLHPFSSNDDVEEVLADLARRDHPLALQVERRPGQKEARWIQLLEVDATARAAASLPPGAADGRVAGRVTGRATGVSALEARVTALERRLEDLLTALGDLVEVPEVDTIAATDTTDAPDAGSAPGDDPGDEPGDDSGDEPGDGSTGRTADRTVDPGPAGSPM